jgi:hypothetical protein
MTQRTVLRWLSSALLALGAVSLVGRHVHESYPASVFFPLGLLTLGFAGIIVLLLDDRGA